MLSTALSAPSYPAALSWNPRCPRFKSLRKNRGGDGAGGGACGKKPGESACAATSGLWACIKKLVNPMDQRDYHSQCAGRRYSSTGYGFDRSLLRRRDPEKFAARTAPRPVPPAALSSIPHTAPPLHGNTPHPSSRAPIPRRAFMETSPLLPLSSSFFSSLLFSLPLLFLSLLLLRATPWFCIPAPPYYAAPSRKPPQPSSRPLIPRRAPMEASNSSKFPHFTTNPYHQSVKFTLYKS